MEKPQMALDFTLRPGTKRFPLRLVATGSNGEYWIGETARMRVQHGRHGPLCLFHKKRIRFVHKDTFPDFDTARDAAEALDAA
jgi:hypothetical protein